MLQIRLLANFLFWPIILGCFVEFISSKQQLVCSFNELFTSCFQCHRLDVFVERNRSLKPDKCDLWNGPPPMFIMFDVNAMEGFNLRRDVYIRLAVFMAAMRESDAAFQNSFLVLPPFHRLYHWNIVAHPQSAGNQVTFWNHFFDVDSMKQYTPILDIWQYFDLMNECFNVPNAASIRIDHVLKLRQFKSMFESGKFTERFQVNADNCDRNHWNDQFIDLYRNFSIGQAHCVEFQGAASVLRDLLRKYKNKAKRKPQTVALLNAETVLHDHWGGVEYWRARRSMRFNKHLVEIANIYRKQKLNSTDSFDKIQQPSNWQAETEHRSAVGGEYLCAHLRRRDFLSGRDATTPTLRSAAKQISNKLKELNLKTVFIASDCTGSEYHDLKSYLMRYHVTKFTAHNTPLEPGAIAIIDQIICSKSRYFIGTFESTFTYRIYEEREILGFRSEMTFNTFCKEPDNTINCTRNAVWPIVYGF